MSLLSHTRNRLSILLWLIGLHSILVGFGLVFLPASIMPKFGLESYIEGFFPVQGGVFHIVMGIAYLLAGIGIEKFKGLITLTILAKFLATIFLLTYFISIKQAWVILASGIGDFVMGVLVLFAFLSYRASVIKQSIGH